VAQNVANDEFLYSVDDLMRKELTNLKKRASDWFWVGGRR